MSLTSTQLTPSQAVVRQANELIVCHHSFDPEHQRACRAGLVTLKDLANLLGLTGLVTQLQVVICNLSEGLRVSLIEETRP